MRDFFPVSFPRAFARCPLVALVDARQTAGKAKTWGSFAGGLLAGEAVFLGRTQTRSGNARSCRARVSPAGSYAPKTARLAHCAPATGASGDAGEPRASELLLAHSAWQKPETGESPDPPPRALGAVPGADPVPAGAGPSLWSSGGERFGFCLVSLAPIPQPGFLFLVWYSF